MKRRSPFLSVLPQGKGGRFFYALRSICMSLLACCVLTSCEEDEHNKSKPVKEQHETLYNTNAIIQAVEEVVSLISTQAATHTTTEHLMKGAMQGLMQSLEDPFAAYLSPQEFFELTTHSRGEFAGIGLEIAHMPKGVVVISVLPDTPAQQEKICVGDMITAIDGITLLDKDTKYILTLLQGRVDTQVSLTIKPHNDLEPERTVSLTRSIIHIKPLHVMVKSNIGYVRLGLFNEQLLQDLQNTLLNFKKQHIRAVIVDLRNNPGGVLQEAVDVTSLFLDKATIVTVKGKNEQDTQVYKSDNKDMLHNIPLVILINKGSASGSEIFAAALKDHKRAILMGEKTFGKGSVQTVYPLPNHGGIKLTTAHFFSPKNHAIHNRGVEPDFHIQLRSAFEFCQNLLN